MYDEASLSTGDVVIPSGETYFGVGEWKKVDEIPRHVIYMRTFQIDQY